MAPRCWVYYIQLYNGRRADRLYEDPESLGFCFKVSRRYHFIYKLVLTAFSLLYKDSKSIYSIGPILAFTVIELALSYVENTILPP
jgi:hypothetical protein